MKRLSLFRFDSNCKTIKFKIQKMVVQLSLNGSFEEIWPFRRCSGSEHEETQMRYIHSAVKDYQCVRLMSDK